MSLQEGNNFDAVMPNYLIDYAKMFVEAKTGWMRLRTLRRRAYDKAKAGQNQTVMGQSLLVLGTDRDNSEKVRSSSCAALRTQSTDAPDSSTGGTMLSPFSRPTEPCLRWGQGNITRAMDLSNQAVAIG